MQSSVSFVITYPFCVLCSHRPRIIKRLFVVIIFLFITRFGQALSSLFHVYMLYVYLVFTVALSSFISSFYYVCFIYAVSPVLSPRV